MIVSNDGASAPTISSAFLSRETPVTRIQSSAPWIAVRLASDCRMPSGVWPTSITVSGSCRMTSRRPGQRASRRPARIAASIWSGALRGCSRRSQSRNRVAAMAALLNWNAPGRPSSSAAKIDAPRTGNRNAALTPSSPRCRCGFHRGRTATCSRASGYIQADAAAASGSFRRRRWCRRLAQASLLSDAISSSELPSSSTCS